MERIPGWRDALAAYLESWHRRAFRPGQADCAVFAAGAVEAMTGATLGDEFGAYTTEAQGRDLLRRAGYAGIADFMRQKMEQIPPAIAGTGDVVLLPNDALGIVSDARVFCLTARGLGSVPRTDALTAYRV